MESAGIAGRLGQDMNMSGNALFETGQTVVVREVWEGRIWRANPYIVVRDSPELIVLYSPVKSTYKCHLAPDGERDKPRRRDNSPWVLIDLKWEKYTLLRLTIPGSGYSVLVIREQLTGKLEVWYINLEEPLRRTELGFDLTDYFLDAEVMPDLSSWRFKDEKEFAEAIKIGLIPGEKAQTIRAEGERVAKWIQSGNSPFNAWANWQPNPSWKVPVLPDGWDKV
jgi:hypothetical protein